MKIEVLSYRVRKIKKKDIRLSIELCIDMLTTGNMRTAAIVQLHPISYFHGKVPEEIFGLLFLSAIVYTIDRSVDRANYSVDGWSREFDVDIRIPEYSKFVLVRNEINDMLSFLTGDYWNCNFIGDATIKYPKYKVHTDYDNISQVRLFSGGLDSLIGAIDYLASNPKGYLYLSSHYDSYMRGPKSDQDGVRKALISKYGKRIKYREAVMISPELSKETSCRSRSLMFVTLASIVASYAKCDVVIPENGSVSLNYPLSPSRRAACSTRTTHPVFLQNYQYILNKLNIGISISNPYEFSTKGEMIQNCKDKDTLMQILPLSNSCGKRNMHQHMFDNSSATHCAHCMPCMYRKASLVGEPDKTTYGNKLETIFMKRDGDVSNDFFAMLDFLKNDLSDNDIKKELYIAGMSRFDNIDEYVDLVKRTRAELSKMLKAENSLLINKYMGWV